MESVNGFSKGMDLDTNPLNLEKGKYREATNVRVINDVGSTSFSINNIKGNLLGLSIPALPIFQKIEIIAATGAATQTLTINGQTGTAFNTTGMTPASLFAYITTDPAYTLYGVQYNIYYGDSYVVFVPIGAFVLTMSTSDSTKIAIDSTYVPAQTNMEVIGSVNIRGDIYIFTTNNKTQNPGGHDIALSADPSSVGQIWRLTYDKSSLVVTLDLIYNNYLDFSTFYAIPPTATTGRYENDGIQRIYWTDNYNKLRSLNVSNPNAIALDPTILDVTPAVDFDIPILTDIRNASGSVKVGTYQCTYRLKNNGGATTNYGPLSPLVNVVSADEASNTGGAGFKDYYGNVRTTSTSKQLTWTISNLDRDYDRIEVVIVYREGVNDPATVIQIYDDPITSSKYTVVFNGTQTPIPITLSEFLLLAGTFTHCKTIGTKDNRLFAANVRNQLSDIDFDARAFRAFTSSASSTDIKLTNNGSNASYTLSAAEALGQTTDTINEYSTGNACKYKPDCATSGVLGGKGVNVSYEFYAEAIAADVDTNASGPFGVPDGVNAPWRHTNPDFNISNLSLGVNSFVDNYTQAVQLYPTQYSAGKINAGFKYPPYTSILKGYQRGEIYRFGIQFFDKSKNPIFVKWIGDIKMPDLFDSCINEAGTYNSFYSNGTATGIQDFRLSFVGNNTGGAYDEAFVQTLGIKFTVNITPTISKLIDGYSIVRVKREEEDKTIVSQGYIHPAQAAPGISSDQYTSSPFVDTSGNTSTTNPNSRGWFVTPNIMESSLTIPAVGMTLKTVAHMQASNSDNSVNFGGDPYYFFKYYAQGAPTSYSLNLEQIDYVGYAGNISDTGSGGNVYNYDYDESGGGDTTVGHAIGNAAYYFRVSSGSPINYSIGGDKYLVNIIRTLTNQYGGATYAARANNVYISCSQYRPIRNVVAALTDTFEVYGGDTYVNMYDSCRWAKNWGTTGRGVINPKVSTTFFFPVESVLNADLRYGISMNQDFNSNPFDAPGQEMKEENFYNTIYSSEDNIVSFYPKPDPFVANEEFDNRVYASEIKINGELTDSWGIFKPDNYWDVEGTYGPIVALCILRDKMYFWQNRAFGLLEINPRAIVTDTNATSNTGLQLGTGLPLQRHDYLSTEVGLQHQWALTKSSYKLFWLDVANRKFFTFGEGESISPESDIKGLFSYMNDHLKYNVLSIDKPTYFDANLGVNGIRAIYDFKYNQAIFTVHDGQNVAPGQSNTVPFTVAFDEHLNVFTSLYSFFPRVYFGDGYKIFSTNPTALSDIYMHDSGNYCKFYGTTQFSTIKLVVNDNPKYSKVTDNIIYDCQVIDTATGINYNRDTWNSIRLYNTYQNTDFQTLVYDSNIKRKERDWKLAVPRNRVLYSFSDSPNIFTNLSPVDKPFGERMRDKYIVIDLIYNNTNNRELSFNNLRTIYRQSSR